MGVFILIVPLRDRPCPAHPNMHPLLQSWFRFMPLPHVLRVVLATSLALVSGSGAAQDPLPAVGAKPVAFSRHLHNGDRIDHIRILGLLELPSFQVNGLRFAEFSDLAWDDDDGTLYAVSDQGGLFGLKPVFTKNYLTDVKLLTAVALREPGSGKPVRWTRTDAEGMDILKGRNGRKHDAELVISFEREPRILRYDTDGNARSPYPLPPPLNNVRNFHGANKALEAVCHDPDLGILTAPEFPLHPERAGHTRIFDVTGKSWYYPADNNNGIVSMKCIGHGQVLILERDYISALAHTTITLKKVSLPATLAPGSTLRPETLVRLDDANGLSLDNFEGLTHHRGHRYFMVSDNNDVFVQRSLLLYFEIIDAK